MGEQIMGSMIEALLFLFMIVLALYIARLRSLFAAAMLFGIFSLISAGMLTLMDAVDVAFTEAAVGAGISTVLFLGALGLTTSEETRPLHHVWSAKLVVIATGLMLAYGTIDMPAYGDPTPRSTPMWRRTTWSTPSMKSGFRTS